MNGNSRLLLPEAASTVAGKVDTLIYFIHYVSVFFFILVVGLILLFVIKYRRRSETETTPRITHHTLLEVTWILVPFAIMLIIFVWGVGTYMDMAVAPGNSINVYVTAQRWSWTFEYPGGATSTNELVVPVGQPIRLTMSSRDLVHGLYVPKFRIKQDVMPNRYTNVWFEATEAGTYDLFCTEYCGTSHSDMTGKVRAVPVDEFKKWLETGGIDPSKMTLAQYGEALYRSKGCVACHSVDGSIKMAPSLKGIFGHDAKLGDGSRAKVDENYVRESMMVPGAKIVAGFGNIMPSYQGLLKDREVNALIEYIKTLGAEAPKPVAATPTPK